jgi:hypothetical protein
MNLLSFCRECVYRDALRVLAPDEAVIASPARDRLTVRDPPVSGAVLGDKSDSVPGPL